MTSLLSDEEKMIADSAATFFSERAPPSQLRELRDSQSARGYDPDVWREMTAQGFAGILVPGEYGGSGLNCFAAGLVQEEIGRNLSRTPMLSTAILGVTALRVAGDSAQRQRILPAIADGAWIMALASDEISRHAPTHIATRAVADGTGFVLNGDKRFVIDGHVADELIVAARTSGEPRDPSGISLFLVDSKSLGVNIMRDSVVDSSNVCHLTLDNVQVSAAALLGSQDAGYDVLERLLDVGRVSIAAELLGIAEEVFSRTVDYLKEREQFGVKIGTFQALQHRAAQLYCDLKLARATVFGALRSLDAPDSGTSLLASVASAKTALVARQATDEGVHMHGGMGMTDAFDIGFYMKRACVAASTFGDSAFHLDRMARLKGY